MPEIQTPRFLCRHIFPDGHRCGSCALRHEEFCYYHHTTRRPRTGPPLRDTHASFDLPLPDDRSTIQAGIGLILQRLAGGGLDAKRAGLLLYGLQIASMNLKKDHKKPLESADTVEETIDDPDHGLIAPVAEIHPEEKEKTLYHAIMEGWNLQDDANPPFPGAIYRPAVPAAWLHPEPTQPQDPTSDSTNCHPSPSREPASVSILPNLQALSEPAEQPPARLEARVHPRPKPSDISNVLAAEVRFGLRNNFFQRLATHPATPTEPVRNPSHTQEVPYRP